MATPSFVLTYDSLTQLVLQYLERSDPAVVAFPDVSPLSLSMGISGKDAMALVSDGVLLAHSPTDALRSSRCTSVMRPPSKT